MATRDYGKENREWNLPTNRKKRQKEYIEKHGKSSKASKIKKDAAIKVSKIHDKYEAIKARGK